TVPGLGYRLEARPERPSRLASLRKLVRPAQSYLWPVSAEYATRGLATPQAGYRYRLGSRVRLGLDTEQWGDLLLLNEGAEGLVYCLCPSRFAPEQRLRPGKSVLPSAPPPYDAFVVAGQAGRELLLALITRDPLGLDWSPEDPETAARTLTDDDIDTVH